MDDAIPILMIGAFSLLVYAIMSWNMRRHDQAESKALSTSRRKPRSSASR
jgi:hypothetical protein